MFGIWVPTFYILISLIIKRNVTLMASVLGLNLQKKIILILYFDQQRVDG